MWRYTKDGILRPNLLSHVLFVRTSHIHVPGYLLQQASQTSTYNQFDLIILLVLSTFICHAYLQALHLGVPQLSIRTKHHGKNLPGLVSFANSPSRMNLSYLSVNASPPQTLGRSHAHQSYPAVLQ